MPKYRKKPKVIDVFQIGVGDTTPDWFMDALSEGRVIKHGDDSRSPFDVSPDPNIWCEIFTLEGIHQASAGDYIIRGIQGELYPCKPDIFKETYELIGDE